MTSPSLELQKAIFDLLKANPAVTALVNGRIYDRVPENPQFPYVSFGTFTETTDDAECIDGFDITIQLSAWSRAVGFPECRQITEAVRNALPKDGVELPTNALVTFSHRITRMISDPDGLTSQGAMTFEAFVEQP